MSGITPNEISVSTQAEFLSALSTAAPGDTILLTAGDYGSVLLKAAANPYLKFADTVTIKSADPGDPASFSGLEMIGVENVKFDGILFDYEADKGAVTYETPFIIKEAKNVEITNSTFDGDLAEEVDPLIDGFGVGKGVYIIDSESVTISDSEVSKFNYGIIVGDSTDITLSGNDVHDISNDGIQVASSQSILVENNHLHDFYTHPDNPGHRDMIQFWSAEDVLLQDIVIRGNYLDQGEGIDTQSIFMRNKFVDLGIVGVEMRFQDILIEDNVIRNSHGHGITVGESDGLVIQNNTLLQHPDGDPTDALWIPTINVAENSVNVSVHHNITPREISAPNEIFVVTDNIVTQSLDAFADYYVEQVFANARMEGNATLNDLMINPELGLEGFGAAASSFAAVTDGIVGFVQSAAEKGLTSQTVSFSAANIYDANGLVDLEGATVTWTFGDGNTAEGVAVDHTYVFANDYDITVTIELADGATVELTKSVNVVSPVLFSVNADDGVADISAYGRFATVDQEVTFEAHDGGQAIRLNTGAIVLEAGAETLNNSEYTVGFDFRSDGDINNKTILSYSSSFQVRSTTAGFKVMVATEEGPTYIYVTADIHDGDWHSFALTFSGETGEAIVYLDGEQAAIQTGFDGQTQVGSTYHDLNIGNIFSDAQYDGLLDNFVMLNAAVDASEVADLAALGQPPAGASAPTYFSDWQSLQHEMQEAGGAEEYDLIEANDGGSTFGDANHDRVFGSELEDLVKTGGGNDEIYGGAGEDTLNGQADNDRLDGGDGDDLLIGHNGDDILVGGAGADRMYGGHGADVYLVDNLGDIVREVGEDIDVVNASVDFALSARVENLILLGTDDLDGYGNILDNELVGNAGSNTLLGGDGNDLIYGGDGDDRLSSHDGDDVLLGGRGTDRLNGGAGADTFVFDEGDGFDLIYGFETGVDVVDLTGHGIADAAELQSMIFDTAKGVEVYLGGGDKLRFVGLDAADVHVDDFII